MPRTLTLAKMAGLLPPVQAFAPLPAVKPHSWTARSEGANRTGRA